MGRLRSFNTKMTYIPVTPSDAILHLLRVLHINSQALLVPGVQDERALASLNLLIDLCDELAFGTENYEEAKPHIDAIGRFLRTGTPAE